MLRAHGAPPAACPRCGPGYAIAPACLAACIAPVPPDACPRCAQPLVRTPLRSRGTSPRRGTVCASLGCARGWNALGRTDVVLGYKRGDVERLVLAAKRLERWAIAALGRVLAGWLLDVARPRAYDVVLPVPFHGDTLRGRPAHPLTAIYLDARPAVWPRIPADDLAPPLLAQIRAQPARRTQSEYARWASVRGAVALAFPTRAFRGARVLVIDDVLTSGATVGECARVLLDDGGAAAVDAVVLARQPWRGRAAAATDDGANLTMTKVGV